MIPYHSSSYEYLNFFFWWGIKFYELHHETSIIDLALQGCFDKDDPRIMVVNTSLIYTLILSE